MRANESGYGRAVGGDYQVVGVEGGVFAVGGVALDDEPLAGGFVAVYGDDVESGDDTNTGGVEVFDEAFGELVHAADDACHLRACRCCGAEGCRCCGEGAVLAQCRAQAGDGGVHVELVGVGGVHAGDDGGDEVVEHFLTHADAHELAEGLRVFASGYGQELVHLGAAQAVLADDGNEGLVVDVAGDAHDAGAGGAASTLRQVQPGAVGVGGDDSVAQAEFFDEVADDGAAGCEGFGAGV